MAKLWSSLCSVWILGVWVQVLHSALSSHFQGASVSWRPGRLFAEEGKRELLIDFRVAWRRGASADSQSTFCDESAVANEKMLGKSELTDLKWACEKGCIGIVASAEVPCRDFDEEDDWSVGFRTVAFNITVTDVVYEIKFAGCCWITSLVFTTSSATPWDIVVYGTVGIRSDTGMPNRSPVTTVTPVIRFQAGCPGYVDLLLFDADQDDVTCRFADCGDSSCTVYPYLKLTQNGDKCRLSYNAGGPGEINVAIFILLEDRPRKEGLLIDGVLRNTTSELSRVPLQFVVRLHTEILLPCSQKPAWVDPTFPNGFVKTAVAESEVRIEIRLRSSVTLDVVKVIGPLGLYQENLQETDPKEYWTNLVFIASRDQIGDHMVCITARDTNRKMSEQRCMILKVGEGTPCDVDNGGCDDKCVSLGASSYVCECERKCWRLSEDRRTCIPDIDVECLTDRFSVELPVCAIHESTVSVGYQIGSEAAPCEAENNGTYYVREVSYGACLTHKESDFSEIHYMSRLRMFVNDKATEEGSGQTPITRGFYYNMDLVCSFNKYANVNATFRPQDQEEGLVRVPGLGSFQFFFDFYVDSNFGATYSPYEYPITVTVNSDLFFAIRTVGGSGLEIFTEKCVAMTTPTPTPSTVSYTMIENGCFTDATMERHPRANVMEDRYSIKAFRFQDNLNADNSVNIYIQCSAVLCIIGDPTTRCRKGCISSRKRREAADEIFVDTRQKRSAEDDVTVAPTNDPNVTESEILEITVSGPFRIKVEQTTGTPLVTVVTPTSVANDTETTHVITHVTKPETTKKFTEMPEKETDSLTLVIIASSVGAALFLLLLLGAVALVCYYHTVLKPRHKIIPDKKEIPSPSVSAWTLGRQDENPSYDQSGPETPPPSFWDVHMLT